MFHVASFQDSKLFWHKTAVCVGVFILSDKGLNKLVFTSSCNLCGVNVILKQYYEFTLQMYTSVLMTYLTNTEWPQVLRGMNYLQTLLNARLHFDAASQSSGKIMSQCDDSILETF